MADYISQFTGGEIDRRLAKVSELEAGKQDKLVSGENIKTIGGQSVLGEGNIPLTDQEAVKFTPQTLTDAQKAQALANIGAASEDEVAALADQKYEGPYESAASLPTASASTMGAIYLVGPDGNGEYDRYVTKLNGSTYTWESLGKTSIDLANYATKAEVGELEAKVDEFNLFLLPFEQGSLYNGNYDWNEKCIYSPEYLDISSIQGGILVINNEKQSDGRYWKVRVAFYNASKTFLSQQGYQFTDGTWNISIPVNAEYARFALSLINADDSDAYCSPASIPTDGTKITGNLDGNIRSQNELSSIKQVETSRNIFDLFFLQGSLYAGIPENNNKCIYCPNYIDIGYISISKLFINNEKQSDGRYWKVRVTFYNSSKTYISQVGYQFTEGAWSIAIPTNARYIRFALSLTNSDGMDAACSPSDIPTDGTQIKFTYDVFKDTQNSLSRLEYEKSELAKSVEELFDAQYPIPLNKMLGYSMELAYQVTSGYGDAACYNGKVFQFIDGNQSVYVHDAETGQSIQTITMPNPSANYHNNCVSFGSEKYDAGDSFPLLYASQEKTSENKCIVYRITGTSGNYSLTVVQTITFPTYLATGLYYHNCLIDTKNNYLVLFGLVNSSWSATNQNSIKYIVFNLPTLSNGNVTLSMTNAVSVSRVFMQMPTTQGGFCKGGFIYQVFGVNAPQMLMVYDIVHKKFCYSFNITEELMNAEPEGAFEYNDKIHIVFNGGAVYILSH